MSKRSVVLSAAAIALAFATSGCLRKDYPIDAPVVSAVTLRGTHVVDPNDVLPGLATAASPRFLGIWDGVVFDYEVFDESLLERDLGRIERYYRARGYYEARVTAARVVPVDGQHVRVELRVDEGEPVLVAGDVATPGLEGLPFDVAVAATRAVVSHAGNRFDEATYELDKKKLVTALADRGYAFAKVTGHVRVDIALHEAHLEFRVEPGARAVYGAVLIAGLKDIPERPVRDNLALVEGKPYSHAEIEDARTALINLGVFATVDIRQDLTHPESGVVPVTVVVQESPLRTLKIGGGMRFDVFEWSANLSAGWEHRNFLGGMRRLSIDLKPGVVFYPTRMDNFTPPTNVLPRNRLRAELRQPAFLEGRTTGIFSAEYNVYPLLYPGLGANPAEHENVIGYQEVKLRAAAERAFFGHHLYVTPSYNWQANFPFAYVGTNLLQKVYVSYPEFTTILDFRDSTIEPRRGVFFSNTVQVAGHIFGGDASDVREQPELRTYLPISKSVVFATRATIGFLFPKNYGSTLENGTTSFTDPASLRDEQLLLFRAFYSGGPNSNRGYPFRGVGPQGILGYLSPSTAACQIPSAPVTSVVAPAGTFLKPPAKNAPSTANVDQSCFRPLGGLTLWEASAEVRFPVSGPFRLAAFVDASDVEREVATIRFTFPHLSPGLGLRYATPVGPVRFDIGYRIPYAQEIGVKTLPASEGYQPTILGLPIAIQFGLGEAF